MTVNILAVIAVRAPNPRLHIGEIAFVPNCVITNMMAAQVYRRTKLGYFQEESISTGRVISHREGQTRQRIQRTDSGLLDFHEDPNSSENSNTNKSAEWAGSNAGKSLCSWGSGWRTPALFILTLALTIIPPTVCIHLCRRGNRL